MSSRPRRQDALHWKQVADGLEANNIGLVQMLAEQAAQIAVLRTALRGLAEDCHLEGHAVIQTCRLCNAEQVVSTYWIEGSAMPLHLHDDTCPLAALPTNTK